jgi:hypothetical protein
MSILDVARAINLLDQPTLRSMEEILEGGARAFANHWRMRQFTMVDPSPLDFEEFARTAWFGPLNIKGVRLVERDLAVGPKAISKARRDNVAMVSSAAMERYLAFNWLVGQSEIYSDTDTST